VAFSELNASTNRAAIARHACFRRDKVLSKQLLSYHRVPPRNFMCAPAARGPIPKKLRFPPAFVKSSTDDASSDPLAHAVGAVADQKQWTERIVFISRGKTQSDGLVEAYTRAGTLCGRARNDRPQVLPVCAMTFVSLPEEPAKPAIRHAQSSGIAAINSATAHHGGGRDPRRTAPCAARAAVEGAFPALCHVAGLRRHMIFACEPLRARPAFRAGKRLSTTPHISPTEDFAQSRGPRARATDLLLESCS